MKRRVGAQTWSLDLVLAAAIFIIVLIVFYTVMTAPKKDTGKDLQDTAELISNRLSTETGDSRARVVVDGKLNDSKLATLSDQDYQDLRVIMGTSKDFCIFVEDENGRLIAINGSKVGVGGDRITLDGTPCNGTLS